MGVWGSTGHTHWDGKRGWASQRWRRMRGRGVTMGDFVPMRGVFAELRKNRDRQLEKNCLQ